MGGNHRPDWVSTYPFRFMLDLPGALEDGHPATKGDIEVGHDVWIGRGARIMSGVTVGNGAVVGAAAVVAGDVRPYAIVVGNPAREVRRRFGEEAIAALERIAWWDWPDERIVEAVPLLSSAQIDRFITEHSGGEVPAQGARPAPPAGADPSRVITRQPWRSPSASKQRPSRAGVEEVIELNAPSRARGSSSRREGFLPGGIAAHTRSSGADSNPKLFGRPSDPYRGFRRRNGLSTKR